MQPLTFYADAANWIDLAEGKVDSGPLEDAIADARIVPVLSLHHLLELASIRRMGARLRVVSYMDSIEGIGPVKWLPHYRDILRREAVSCFQGMFQGTWESPVAFFDTFHDTVPITDPEIIKTIREGLPPLAISDIVNVLAGIEEFEKYRADCSGYPDLRQSIVRGRRVRSAKKRFTEVELRTLLAQMLPGHVDHGQRQKFAEAVDLTQCPAFRAHWAFHEGANLDPKTARPSDIADIWHLAGVVSCDVGFADRGTVEALRKGNYDKLPRRNAEFPGWVQSLV